MNNESKSPLVCLQVAFPKSLEEELLDVCRAMPDVPGFTVVAAEGFGADGKLHTVRETVLGRAQRRLLIVVARHDVCARVVETLRGALPVSEAAYWIVPVWEFGRFA